MLLPNLLLCLLDASRRDDVSRGDETRRALRSSGESDARIIGSESSTSSCRRHLQFRKSNSCTKPSQMHSFIHWNLGISEFSSLRGLVEETRLAKFDKLQPSKSK